MSEGTAPSRSRSIPHLSGGGAWLGAVPLAFVGLFFLYPTVALIARGLAEAGRGTMPWSRVVDAATTTLWLASAGTALTLLIGLPATWALTRREWRGRRLAKALTTVPFVLPTIVVATAFRALTRGSQWAATEAGASLILLAALVFFNIAVVVRIVGPAWETLDDRTYWAARVLGANAIQAAWHERGPALARAVAAAAATVWLFCSASFGLVVVLGGGRISTIDTEIWIQANQFLNLSAAAFLGILQVLVVSLALLAGAWVRRRQRSASARTVFKVRKVSGPKDVALVVAALAPAALLAAAPLIALVSRSVSTASGITLDHYRRLLSNERLAGANTTPGEALARSLTTSLVVAAVAVVFALALAMAITRIRHGLVLHGLVLLPLGVSSVVVGLGMLITLSRPLPGNISLVSLGVLVPAAHIVVALPLALSVVLPAFKAIDPRLTAAAASLGASPWRVFASVEWPLVRRAVAMATGLAAAVSLGEFGASTFLTRPGTETLPTLIFRLLARPGPENLGTAFAAAALLAIITAAVMLVSDRTVNPGDNR